MGTGQASNAIFDKVLDFIEYTNQHIFLTGKAGTGKTTLLQRIRTTSAKKLVVLAPTGVAAMNAGGTTVNSFFQLPPGSFFPGDVSLKDLQTGLQPISSVVAELSYSREKLHLFRELELLIVDEVSMVRCDLLDVMDAILRNVRKQDRPFGGVQVLLIGDLFQLPPVTRREEWNILGNAYRSPYFFDAQVVRQYPLLQIELDQVFRQTEPEFIQILNAIRNNHIDSNSLQILNRRYEPDFKPTAELNPIVITSHNAEAHAINMEKLEALPGDLYTFEGSVSGDFKDMGLQAEQTLMLKTGAQVMFVKNDTGENRKFYNGKIGRVSAVRDGEVWIAFPGEEDLLLERTSWQSFEYQTNPEEAIVQRQIGEFSQYPIKLAWAVTIHKSQGLTFDHAVIDAGKSFVSGQVYVALSRVRTLSGLILRSQIGTESLRSNPEVLTYLKPAVESELDTLLIQGQEAFILQLILQHFQFNRVISGFEDILSNPEVVKSNLSEFKLFITSLLKSSGELLTVAERFQKQIRQLFQQNGFDNQSPLQERILSANQYFSKALGTQLIQPLNKQIRIKATNKLQQQVQHLMIIQRQEIENCVVLMQSATELLSDKLEVSAYREWIQKHRSKAVARQAQSGKQPIALQLF